MYPQIYIGQIPATARERTALRERALDLHARLRQSHAGGACAVLLSFAAGAEPPAAAIDLLLLRPETVIVGAVRGYTAPIEVGADGRWRDMVTGREIVEEDGMAPLQRLRAQRDAVRMSLDAAAARLGVRPEVPRPFTRVVGALICAPATHPDSRISLDVDDHRDGLKVLGLDELPGLAAMVRSGATLPEEGLRGVMAGVFGGRLWHDGARLLFELAPARFRLRVRGADGATTTLPLYEGESIAGRRRSARRFERRVPLLGDDAISSDHALLAYGDGDGVLLRDGSKNGTWVTPPGGPTEHLRAGERRIEPGTLLRMGATELLLERADDGA